MRAFIAIDLNEEVKRVVGMSYAIIAGKSSGVKWVKEENLHITLEFLGNISRAKLDSVMDVLQEVSVETKSFGVSGGFVGGFPRLDNARVIFLGLDDGKIELLKLFDKLEHKLAKKGFNVDKRSYHPHITLGRAKRRPINLSEFRNVRAEFYQEVKGLVLFESILTPQGPVYKKVFEGDFS